jgi:hypothetical protein
VKGKTQRRRDAEKIGDLNKNKKQERKNVKIKYISMFSKKPLNLQQSPPDHK